ncbi:MAG: FAD-binding domain-containing protein, partial [Minisyncoccia bacterium]
FGFKRLKTFDFINYNQTKNFPGIDGSSKLSPYIRFGIISIRKIFNQVKDLSENYIRELAWREFWYHIKFYFNEFYNLEFQEKRRNLIWENNKDFIEKFFNAQTGYPIVDAGIIQLKTENWVHNRVRMILANFLTKDLLVDWRIGEKFFKDYLLDYDEVVNVGNWQWSASVGPDPKPFRIFNPMIQSQKFDLECIYIKKYIPELKKEENYKIHNPLKYKLNYYSPIINHFSAIKKAKNIFLKKNIINL